MMHELKRMVDEHQIAKAQKKRTVVATVVALEGSSYRRPGVRMLIHEDGKMTGAVSGGCVEKEILRQSRAVFETDIPKMMAYDGRFRLGCEGILYILIEPFDPSASFMECFSNALRKREAISIDCYYTKELVSNPFIGSIVHFSDNSYVFAENNEVHTSNTSLDLFDQTIKPCFQLLIVGAEHDAVQLSTLANLTGWEVTIVAPIDDRRTSENFPGAKEILHLLPNELRSLNIDQQTAIVLMTHSYSKDLQFLLALYGTCPAYIGILGAYQRREKLLSEFLELAPDLDPDFFELVHGPSGLNIGAETPEEISVSIISEILSVVNKKDALPLKKKKDKIHD